jgi:hypothetical protein
MNVVELKIAAMTFDGRSDVDPDFLFTTVPITQLLVEFVAKGIRVAELRGLATTVAGSCKIV